MDKLLTEFLGTMLLAATAVLAGETVPPTGAIAVGAVLIALICMGGPISGAQYNPAVTLAVGLVRGMPITHVPLYWVAQGLGALVGVGMSAWIAGKNAWNGMPGPGFGVSLPRALGAEMLFTFALVLVILHTAVSARAKQAGGGSVLYPAVAIGLTVMGAALVLGNISGGVLNPAIAGAIGVLGLIKKTGGVSQMWIYAVGPVVGALAAAGAYMLQQHAGAIPLPGDRAAPSRPGA
jgi:aquaporin Z